jgi:hypothetical protein
MRSPSLGFQNRYRKRQYDDYDQPCFGRGAACRSERQMKPKNEQKHGEAFEQNIPLKKFSTSGKVV